MHEREAIAEILWPTLYVANQGVTMKLRFGGKAVPT